MTSASPRYRIVSQFDGWQVEALPAYADYWQYLANFQTFDEAAAYLNRNFGVKISVVTADE